MGRVRIKLSLHKALIRSIFNKGGLIRVYVHILKAVLQESIGFLFYSLLVTLRQITLETVGGLIMHVNLLNKTIIYERIVGKNASIYIT